MPCFGGWSCFLFYLSFAYGRKINTQIWRALQALEQQNYEEALYGNDNFYGLDALAHGYRFAAGTKIARYSAALAALHLEKYEEVIGYLEGLSFSQEDIQVLSQLALADAFIGIGAYEKSIPIYQSIYKTAKKTSFFPVFVKKYGLILEQQQKNSSALALYKEVLSFEINAPELKQFFEKNTARLMQ